MICTYRLISAASWPGVTGKGSLCISPSMETGMRPAKPAVGGAPASSGSERQGGRAPVPQSE
jgi:hypothetical protein